MMQFPALQAEPALDQPERIAMDLPDAPEDAGGHPLLDGGPLKLSNKLE